MKLTSRTVTALAFLAQFATMLSASSAFCSVEKVQYKSGADQVSAFLVKPEGPGKHPAIIVIHEFWGLNDWVRSQAKRFAEAGYVALAVDLYRGKVATTADTAHQLMRGLPDDRAIRDLRAAYDYLASRSDVDATKIGADGWCMGGGWSLKLAMAEPKLAACALNYGQMPTEASNIAKIQAPVLGNFGAQDQGITPESVKAFETAMKSAGKSVDMKLYDDAGHAFANPENKDGYRPLDAADAWKRTMEFFDRTLRRTLRGPSTDSNN